MSTEREIWNGVTLRSTELLDLSQLKMDESAWIPGITYFHSELLSGYVCKSGYLIGPELPVANSDFQLVLLSDSTSNWLKHDYNLGQNLQNDLSN